MKRLRSAFLALLVIGCAHQAPPPAQESVQESRQHAEIATLEERIAERKASLQNENAHDPSAPVPMSGEEGVSAVPSKRCDGVCQAAEDICTCYRRICRLASEINDEKSAKSCHHAQRECEDASRDCSTCH
jgi:hypothetical protein